MADLTADFEAGTNGNVITTGGGEASATAWSSINGSPTYDNTNVAHGTLAGKFSGAAGEWARWDLGDGNGVTDWYARFYGYVSDITQTTFLLNALDDTSQGVCDMLLFGSKLYLRDSDTSQQPHTTASLSSGQYFRVELHVTCNATTGTMEFKYFASPNATSPTETLSASNAHTRTETRFWTLGCPTASGTATVWMDNIIANATSYPGPVPGPPALQTFKRFYGPAQLSDAAADLYTVPASTVARVMGIHASNPSGSPVDLTLSIGADGAATRVYDGYALAADRTLDDHSPYELAAGEKIQGFASSASTVVLTITGWEKPA